MKARLIWVTLAVAAVWLGVLFISLLAPDLVSGSQQEHLKIAAGITWISGAFATRSVLNMMLKRSTSDKEPGQSLPVFTGLVTAIWLAVTLISILVPPAVTGTDPTSLPIISILAPIAGAILTGLIGNYVERIQPELIAAGTMSSVACPNCGKENPAQAKFCGNCGMALAVPHEAGFCPKCGAKATVGSDYCGHCGSKLAQA